MVCEEICALGGVLGYVALIWWNNELSGNWYCLYSECTSCCNCVCIIVQLYPLGVMSNIGGDIWLLDTAVILDVLQDSLGVKGDIGGDIWLLGTAVILDVLEDPLGVKGNIGGDIGSSFPSKINLGGLE